MPPPALLIAGGIMICIAAGFAINEFILRPRRERLEASGGTSGGTALPPRRRTRSQKLGSDEEGADTELGTKQRNRGSSRHGGGGDGGVRRRRGRADSAESSGVELDSLHPPVARSGYTTSYCTPPGDSIAGSPSSSQVLFSLEDTAGSPSHSNFSAASLDRALIPTVDRPLHWDADGAHEGSASTSSSSASTPTSPFSLLSSSSQLPPMHGSLGFETSQSLAVAGSVQTLTLSNSAASLSRSEAVLFEIGSDSAGRSGGSGPGSEAGRWSDLGEGSLSDEDEPGYARIVSGPEAAQTGRLV